MRQNRSAERRAPSGLGTRALMAATIAVLCAPIVVMLVFSFNEPATRFNYELHRFSVNAWVHPFAVPQLGQALKNSVLVALLASLLAMVLGTPMGFALGRFRFRGRSALTGLTFMSLATPEVVLGAGLLTIFVTSAVNPVLRSVIPTGLLFPLGFVTLVIAHTTLGMGFVVITVRSRVQGLPEDYESAARDLGAPTLTALRTVVLPMIMPGVLAGGILAFAVSLDDFVLTNFTTGGTQMYPTWVYSLMRRALPPQVDVVGLILFAIALAAVLLSRSLAQRDPRDVEVVS
jgi:spermidine/putrescine transport system permease protein